MSIVKIRLSVFSGMAPCELVHKELAASYYVRRLPEYGGSDVGTCQCTQGYNLKKEIVDSQ
jgi:hypothetical protein